MSLGVYDLYAIQYGSSSNFGNIQDQSLNPGITDAINTGSGTVDRRFTAVLSQQPTVSFSTTAVLTAITAIGINGAKIDGTNKLVMYLESLAHGGIKTSGSAHYKIALDDGIVYPTKVSASQYGYATIAYQGHLADSAGDGGSPIAVTASSALAGTAHIDEGYTVGAVAISGTTITGIQSIDIDFGIQVLIKGGDGSVYPRHISIVRRDPVLTIRTLDPTVTTLIGTSGDLKAESLASGATVKLSEVSKNGTVNLSAGLVFTVAEGLSSVTSIGGSHGDSQMYEFVLHPTFDGTNDIVQIAEF